MTCAKCEDKGFIPSQGGWLWCDCAIGLELLFKELPAAKCLECQDQGRRGVSSEKRQHGEICDCAEGQKLHSRLKGAA